MLDKSPDTCVIYQMDFIILSNKISLKKLLGILALLKQLYFIFLAYIIYDGIYLFIDSCQDIMVCWILFSIV